ncbi:MAG: glutamate synthase subunit beta [Xanthomonadales bacterium]|nr:glutamate synthase subunit beta [Xanthomonadales bacterium]
MKSNLFENRFDPSDTLTFLKIERGGIAKRDSNKRRFDFKEVYRDATGDDLSQQSGRCLDCGNPYCEWKCPLHNYIPNWLEMVAKGQYQRAAELMHETNPLPEICGRVCPQDRLCEQACTLNTGFGAVTIGAIEKNISDRALANNWRPDLSKVKATGKIVAIVGAGPAGLGCAELLARNGVKPVVFDRYPEIGGLLTFGIPEFKLEKEVLRKRRQFLEDIGVVFKLNTDIGKDVKIESLQKDYDAVFLGMGTYTPNDGDLKGRDTAGVLESLDYLIGNVNHNQAYEMPNYPYTNLKGMQVVVLGGGDTAMDCVRSAVRQQASSVTCVYRRSEADMPGSRQEVQNAKEEGVEFIFNLQPTEIQSTDERLNGVAFKATEPLENAGDEVFLEADNVIIAFGFKASPAKWFEKLGIKQDQWGRVTTLDKPAACNDPSLPYSQRTHTEGVYAGGDMVRGADLVVTAIAEGRQAAREIMAWLDI